MPEMYFHVRWPDGETQRCYSPSTVVEDYLTASLDGVMVAVEGLRDADGSAR